MRATSLSPSPSLQPPPPHAVHRGHSLPGRAAHWLRTALELGLPATCAGCGRWDTALCPQCRDLVLAEPAEVEQAEAAGDLEILAACSYRGPVRSLVLGWKNGSREDLEELMGSAGRRLGGTWAARHRARLPDGTPPRTLLVVPAPSGPLRRLRGRLVAARLADSVATGIVSQWSQDPGLPGPARHCTVLSTDLLRRRGSPRTRQAGRSARQRRANRVRPPRVLADVRGLPVLLVDDVVTTGATLGACATALREAGAAVLGALTLAAAPRPGPAASATYQLWLPGPLPSSPSSPGDLSATGDHDSRQSSTTRPSHVTLWHKAQAPACRHPDTVHPSHRR